MLSKSGAQGALRCGFGTCRVLVEEVGGSGHAVRPEVSQQKQGTQSLPLGPVGLGAPGTLCWRSCDSATG